MIFSLFWNVLSLIKCLYMSAKYCWQIFILWCLVTVELPPQKMDTDTAKILMFDQGDLEKKDKENKEGDSRLNIEVINWFINSSPSTNPHHKKIKKIWMKRIILEKIVLRVCSSDIRCWMRPVTCTYKLKKESYILKTAKWFR